MMEKATFVEREFGFHNEVIDRQFRNCYRVHKDHGSFGKGSGFLCVFDESEALNSPRKQWCMSYRLVMPRAKAVWLVGIRGKCLGKIPR